MPPYSVLIVDDHTEVRKVLRSGLETLGPEFEVIDLPSGEEALLEVTRQPLDLLVADYRLAGMTGLELKDKILKRSPQLKVILITGVTDPKTRQRVADGGADAFFLKPIPMADFLEAVKRCLGIHEPSKQEQTSSEAGQAVHSGDPIQRRLAGLRQELKAISVVLLDSKGRLLAGWGDLPDGAVEIHEGTINSKLVSTLVSAHQNSLQISQFLGSKTSGNLLCFEGSKYNLALAHVGEAHALLVVANKGAGPEYLSTLGFSIHMACRDILAMIGSLPQPSRLGRGHVDPPADAQDPSGSEDDEQQTGLEGLFKAKASQGYSSQEADAFWEQAVEGRQDGGGHQDDGVLNGEVISYDEARKLGLTPDKEDG